MLQTLFASLVLLWVASAQSPGIDLLDTGIVFNGPVQFERGTNATDFTVADHDSRVSVRVETKRAFSRTPNDSMSYQWGQMLARAHNVSIRMADIRDMQPGTVIRSDLLEMVTCFAPTPEQRTDTEMYYMLRCFASDEKRRARTDGKLIYEIDIVVMVPSHSTADRFLSKPREMLYVRLEPGR